MHRDEDRDRLQVELRDLEDHALALRAELGREPPLRGTLTPDTVRAHAPGVIIPDMGSSTKFDKPRIEVNRSPTKCPYCHDDVRPAEDAWVVCSDCLARHHKECWQDSARCSSCGQTSFLEPAGLTVFRAPAPTRAASPKTARQGDWPTLVVSKQGGDFATIGEAIRAAEPGMKIMIAAGTYHESVVIDKPLALIGRGRREEIVIETHGSGCILMQTDQAIVRGVTLRTRATGMSHAAHAVVNVPHGVLRLWDCDVGSDSNWPCISVTGKGAPLVRRCRLHGGLAGAILVSEHGGGTFEDCEVTRFRQYGIAVKTGANPTFERCQVHGAPVGIFVDENGRGSFKDCEVWNASEIGIRVQQGASPIFARAKVHDCTDGVVVHESGEGTFEECAITASKRSNVVVEREGRPTFTRCKLDRSLGAGVTVQASGLGRFDDCTVNENAHAGVAILLGAHPKFERTKIRRNGRSGVWVRQNGRGHFEGCDLTQNDAGPWLIEGRCHVSRRDNRE